MITKDENFVRMAQSVDRVVEKNQVVWSHVNSFSNNVTSLQELLKALSDNKQTTQQKSTGATLDKLRAEDIAINSGVNLAQRASVYALDNNNMQLYNQLNVHKTELKAMHDNNCIAQLKNIAALLSPIIGDLNNYGVTATELQQMKSDTNAYETILNLPRQVIVERKSNNQVSKEIIAQIRFVLMKMDKQINIFADSQFEKEYENARIIIDLGGRFEEDDDDSNEVLDE